MPVKKTITLFSFLFSFITLIAQTKMNNYQQSWNRIESLVQKKGLIQDALKEVDAIYLAAKKENNQAQFIKALYYKLSYNEQLSEVSHLEGISAIEKEILTAKEPALSLLYSIAAKSYWNYLQQNRWKFYSRTATTGFNKANPDTWGIADFHEKISALYRLSLQHQKELQQIRLEPYDAIIIKGNSRRLRPTLFDLLTHEALDYFKNDERNINKPAYAFEINDPAAFADAAGFASHTFISADSASLHYKALQLFQRIISFHLPDTDPEALLDADLERIQFSYAYSVSEDKNDRYKQALENIIDKYPSAETVTQAIYLLAEWYAAKARQYDPQKDTANRYAYITAKELCEKALLRKADSEGKYNCGNLLKEIGRWQIQLQAEKVNIPGEPFRILASYRNVSTLYFRLIKIDKKTREGIGNTTWEDEYWKKWLNLAPLKSFSDALPDTKDYQQHRVELKMEGLASGEYALIASADKNFALQGGLALQFINVSNIAYINKDNRYYVLHRNTGQPLQDAAVQVWQTYYDYKKNKQDRRPAATYRTDKNGLFIMRDSAKKQNGNVAFQLEITYKNDHLFLDDQAYTFSISYEQPQQQKNRGFLFSDRSIYRPGQIVYFKGILVNTDPTHKKSTILTNTKSTVILSDANGQPVDSLSLITNAFGSYSGRFTLPANVLNGEFTILDKSTESAIAISVEEYKRPKFYVEIEKPAGTYRLEDTISLKGRATAYAGNNINGAAVNYRVVRKTMFPMRMYSSRIWPPYPAGANEIAHGTIETDNEGRFVIPFKAMPDKNIPKNQQPVFYYEVTADITDINGETRSGNANLSVAYQALKLQIMTPETLPADSLTDIRISSVNLNDLFEKTTVKVSVNQLAMPAKVFRERYWQEPDQFIMTREAYYRDFPYDLYKDENDPEKWPKGKKMFETSGLTSPDSGFPVNASTWQPGWYVIEAVTRDKYNELITATQYIRIYRSTELSVMASAAILSDKTTAEPGDKLRYQLLSNLDDVFVIHQVMKNGASGQTAYTPLNKKNKPYEINITEADRGGIMVDLAAVKHNRFYSDQLLLNVPFTNKELAIDYETYRDKTLPGNKEEWKVRIRGYKKEQVAAEVVTAMYDASLDQFKPQKWIIPSLWNSGNAWENWENRSNFSVSNSEEKMPGEDFPEHTEKEYDRLIFASSPFRVMEVALAPVATRASGGKLARGMASMAPGLDITKKGYSSEEEQNKTEEPKTQQAPGPDPSVTAIRKNFNETAFFFPELQTDSSGNIGFSFTTPEALTQWKWMMLAHTKDLAFGYGEKTIVTQKQLMVQPNAPRFLREGDRMDFSAKIVNMSPQEITGQVELQLIDPDTKRAVDGLFKNVFPNQYFTVGAGQSFPVSFSIDIPFQYNKPVTYRIIASAAIADTVNKKETRITDGEESTLPVISNRMLVTESLPLPVRGNASKQFRFGKLLESGKSETLQHHSLTVEFTSNPSWYAVQALPYLADNKFDNAEQLFNRFYANALAARIANSSPLLREIFNKWNISDTSALLSQLQKNEELKAVLLQETPWVLEAKTEAQQRKNIALLFDMVRMTAEIKTSLDKLKELQSPNGGFVWFKGGPDDRYMTQYILSGIGRLKKLNAIPDAANAVLQTIIKQAIPYLDKKIQDDYTALKKNNKKMASYLPDNIQAQYLYMRSFFIDRPVSGAVLPAYHYYRNQSKQSWTKQSRYIQGMIALSLFRTGEIQVAKNILASLKQYAIVNEEMGMYWKEVQSGFYWHQAPVEIQSLMIEAFTEVIADNQSVDNLKTWLLKNKQTNNWKTSRATADACYALLLRGTDWLTTAPAVNIIIGDRTISTKQDDSIKTEAGTGYFKKVIEGSEVKSSMGDIRVELKPAPDKSGSIGWGAVYWQYFEDLDKITHAETPLKLTKKLFIEKNTDKGPALEPLDAANTLHVGDKVKVRIELQCDRDMEYVQMKDMRAAAMEPLNVISQYKWQGGLGYYETVKDASTSFFFNYLPKGVYVFEYTLFASHAGTFSNGITVIQSMYAPEFTSQSEGIKVNIENK